MQSTPIRPPRPAGRPRRTWVAIVAAVSLVGVVLLTPTSTTAVEILGGTVDSTAATAPRWVSTDYTPTATGEATFTLAWTGDGDLAMDVRESVSGVWVAADLSSEQPKSVTAMLSAGVTYRVAVWARSGIGEYSLDTSGGTTSTSSTSTTTSVPTGQILLQQGVADASGATGPRWTQVLFTPSASGDHRFDLTWTGTGDLDLDVRLATDRSWIAADTSADHPKSLTTDLSAGVAVAVAVWASTGTGTYSLSVTPPGGPPPSTTTTTTTTTTSTTSTTTTTVPEDADCWFSQVGSTSNIQWIDDGGFHVLRRNDAWLASPGSGVDSYLDTAAPPDATYELRTWLGGTRLDRPCVESGAPPPPPPPPAAGLVVQRGTVSASGDPRASMSHTAIPSTNGPVTATLEWNGAADLDLQVVRVSTGSVVASAATNANPESVTFSVTPGTEYRITTTARSGTAEFALGLSGHRTFPDAPDEAPNILIINVDDARPEALAVMPEVVEWFGEQGTRFPNATVSTPSCCPSRATLMTGQYVHNNGQRDQDTPSTDEYDSIQRHLVDHGYLTGHSGKYLHYYDHAERAPYWDRWNYFKGGYNDVWVNRDGQVLQSPTYSTIMTFEQSIAQVEDFDAFDDERPWYLHVTPVAPHGPSEPEPQYANAPVPPWDPPPSVGEEDRSDKPDWVRWIDQSEADAAVERTQMLRTMITVGDQVDALMSRLSELGELDDTIAIFTSDNGVYWGEHRLRAKFLPYAEAVEVPFLIRWPGQVAAGAVDERFIAHVDILPTVLTAAGIAPDHVVDGTNILDAAFDRTTVLAEYWEDPANNNGIPDWTSITTDASRFVEYFDQDGSVLFREYYDLIGDPHELVNLLADGVPGNDPDVAALSDAVAAARSCSGASCP